MPLLFPNEDPFAVRNRFKPDVIIGKLGTIREEVREFYTNMGTQMLDLSADQDTTALHKCIIFVKNDTPDLDKSNLCILAGDALGGRFDHEMGNVNALLTFSDMRIVLLSEECLILLLSKNYQHEINILQALEGPYCGLIPIGTSSSVSTTSGLEWNLTKLRLLADGGSNRVYDEMPLLFPNEDPVSVRNRYKPNAIIGDLDSIRAEVREFYTNLGTLIVDLSAEQDTTDLHKCINFVRDFTPNFDKSNLCVLVGDALGGRFDHEMGNINVLSSFLDMRIVLLSEACLILLLSKNYHHEINILPDIEGPQCGLIPIGTSFSISTTTGLQWDLNDTEMHFGGLISTSNIVREKKITVRSDSDLLWTISIQKQI